MDNILLNYWDEWKGSILCLHSKKLFYAEELRLITKYTSEKLKNAGIKSGEIIAVILYNTVAFPVCLIALLQLGANPLLLHRNTTKEEIKKLSQNIAVNWVIKDDIYSEIESKESFIAKHFNIGSIWLNITPNYPESDKINETGVILHQTSGTYGKPLQCIRNQKVAVEEAINYTSSISEYYNIKIRITTPLNHAFAYGFGLVSSIITHSTMIIDTEFNPKKILNEETKETSDIICVVPPMLNSFIYLKKMNNSFTLPRSTYYAGTMCNLSISNDFEAAFNNKLFAILGSTETGAISCNNENNIKVGGVGKLLNNVEILIKNKSNYKNLGEDIGELYVKSTSMMQRYCNDKNREAIDYFKTGDIVKFDENNCLHIIGRIKDIINIGGIKFDPIEVEKILLEYHGINDAIVYPGQSENGDEIVLAAVSSNTNLNKSDIIMHCEKYLSIYKIPNKISIIESIPRTNSGKPLKTKLPGYRDNRVY